MQEAGEQSSRPEDVVRLCETLGKRLRELGEVGTQLGGASGERLLDYCAAKVSARLSFFPCTSSVNGPTLVVPPTSRETRSWVKLPLPKAHEPAFGQRQTHDLVSRVNNAGSSRLCVFWTDPSVVALMSSQPGVVDQRRRLPMGYLEITAFK